jgi:hypothetical protein
MRRASLLVLGTLAALAAGCGQSNPKLIPQSNADSLTKTADAIQAACDNKDRSEARAQVHLAENEIAALPRTVDAKLRTNLSDWVQQISDRIADDCKDAEATPTPTESPTDTPTETPSATETATSTPTATATKTATPAPTDTPTAAPTDTATAAPTDTPTTQPPEQP